MEIEKQKKKKNTTALCVALPTEQYKEIESIIKACGITKAEFLRKAAHDLIKSCPKKETFKKVYV